LKSPPEIAAELVRDSFSIVGSVPVRYLKEDIAKAIEAERSAAASIIRERDELLAQANSLREERDKLLRLRGSETEALNRGYR
jgi:hypothetical protein